VPPRWALRAFIRLRKLLSTHKPVLPRLDELERKYQAHDSQIKVVFEAIRKLIATPVPPERRIGFSGCHGQRSSVRRVSPLCATTGRLCLQRLRSPWTLEGNRLWW
jgi:hypothetical protein